MSIIVCQYCGEKEDREKIAKYCFECAKLVQSTKRKTHYANHREYWKRYRMKNITTKITLTPAQEYGIYQLHGEGFSMEHLSRKYGVGRYMISDIIHKQFETDIWLETTQPSGNYYRR